MAFELAIAVKRDPAEAASASSEHIAVASRTLIFDADGIFSAGGAAELAEMVDGAIAPEFDAYIVCLRDIRDIDREALVRFLQWVSGRRDEGVDVRVGASETQLQRLLHELCSVSDALIPLDRAADEAPRLSLDAHRDVQTSIHGVTEITNQPLPS
ncbi:MAG: hypothetical protein M3R51_02775 [Candidatus Eremiobacteraeota bacterium]|nr:hypothetical protein [Candidatus Eremiobacteraeota bacterium]